MEVSLVFWVALVATLLTVAWKAATVVWLQPRRLERVLRQQGMGGTPYQLLIGDLRKMSKMRKDARKSMPANYFSNSIVPLLEPFLQQCVQKYGKCCYTWLGPFPVVNVMDGKLVKEVLSRVYDFGKPDIGIGGGLLTLGLVIYEGEKWTKHRKILNPAFHLERLKSVVAASCESCKEMMCKWEMLLSPEGACEVDILPCIDYLTGDVISRSAFGSNYEEGRSIFTLQKEQLDLVSKAFRYAFIPGSRFFPTRLNRRMKQIDGEIKASLRGIIDKKYKAIKEGEVGGDDLLGLLLESNYREIQESGHEKGMSTEDVINECKGFYLAGQETTAVMIVWTMILLSRHRDWQARAREEILQVFGDKEPDFHGVFRLKIVNMILLEVLRLYPPVLTLFRTNHTATRLGPYSLPSGVIIYMPIALIQHDPQLWGEDAQFFKPERFSEGASKASVAQSPLSFLSFSSGPRVCIGQNFALLEAKATLAMILQRFSMELTPSYKHAPSGLFTIRPEFGAPLVLRKL